MVKVVMMSYSDREDANIPIGATGDIILEVNGGFYIKWDKTVENGYYFQGFNNVWWVPKECLEPNIATTEEYDPIVYKIRQLSMRKVKTRKVNNNLSFINNVRKEALCSL